MSIKTSGFSAAALRWPKQLNMPHLDAAENAFFLRELENISKKMLNVKYASLKGRLMVPTDNEGLSAGHMSHTYRVWDSKGEAKRIADMSDDLPAVNIFGSENTQRLQAYGVSYNFSLDEIAAAAQAGRPLESDRAAVARKVLEQKIDAIAALGDSAAGLTGLLNLTGTATCTPGNKAAGGTTWAVATADEILLDLNKAKREMRVDTKEIESPTRIVLPTAQYEIISSKRVSTVSDTTVLGFFKANNPEIEILSWERLAGAGGASDDRALVYSPSPENLKLLMALEFTQQPPQARNMAFVVNCWVKTGGVICPFPKSVSYMDGI